MNQIISIDIIPNLEFGERSREVCKMYSKFLTCIINKSFLKYPCCISVTVFTVMLGILLASFLEASELQTQLFGSHIQGGKVVENKTVARVIEGQTVELHWTSDKDLELHLHGYDILLKLKKNILGKMKFSADKTGRFPVTIHDLGSHGHSAIFYLEVHPD